LFLLDGVLERAFVVEKAFVIPPLTPNPSPPPPGRKGELTAVFGKRFSTKSYTVNGSWPVMGDDLWTGLTMKIVALYAYASRVKPQSTKQKYFFKT
jgi:hypothetical protein